jgi:hypothetical protein
MSRALDRRVRALEATWSGSGVDPWQAILRELPDAALTALEALLTAHAADPTGPVVEAGCARILGDFAPSPATLERWQMMAEVHP